MPLKLSDAPSLYQPPLNVTELEADLQRFSDPEEYDQEDPLIQIRQHEVRTMVGDPSPDWTEEMASSSDDNYSEMIEERERAARDVESIKAQAASGLCRPGRSHPPKG